jgi:hypothetical protein
MNNTISQHWTSDEEKLEAFVLHKIIDKEEISNLAAHLEKCNECRKRVQEEREFRIGIQRFGRMEMKRRLKLRLRRDRSRRFEWTHVASLAAAIVLVFSAVFTVRWFFDVEKEKTQVREIVLQENKPEERALWIIGRVIEINDKSSSLAHLRTSPGLIADNLQSEAEANQSSRAESKTEADEAAISAAEERQEIVKEERPKQQVVSDSKINELPASSATKTLKSQDDAPFRASKSAAPILRKMSDSRDSIGSEIKESPLIVTKERLGYRKGYGSIAKQSSGPAVENTLELRQPDPAKAKTGPALIAQKALKDKNVPAVLVRRGDLKDLPASLRNGDVSIIHTRLERTSQGILLTFYSSAITDSVATDIEAIAPDSIIVTFRNRQIAYHIPGGLSGKI